MKLFYITCSLAMSLLLLACINDTTLQPPSNQNGGLLARRDVFIDGGANFTCFNAQGSAYCWGDGQTGRLGNGRDNADKLLPVRVSGLSSGVVTGISTGGSYTTIAHACAIVAGGVKCWGSNSAGQLGDGTKTSRNTPIDVSSLGAGSNVSAITNGKEFSCALISGGVKCWGEDYSGELGNGPSNQDDLPVPANVLTISDERLVGVTAISASNVHICAIIGEDENVTCWGAHFYGRLGTNMTQNHYAAGVLVRSFGDRGELSDVKRISAGEHHTCAIVGRERSILCWGRNHQGQLGNNDRITQFTPVRVQTSVEDPSPLENAWDIATGGARSCALLIAGTVKCWGANGKGQIGNGTTDTRGSAIPRDVSNLSNITHIGLGDQHSCAVQSSDASIVYCWGAGLNGELGTGGKVNSSTPTRVGALP